jgi:putative two-component system response regulator
MSDDELAGMRLLIVDDNASSVALLEAMLAEAGYGNLVATQNPRLVRELCLRWQPDLLLLDLRFPDMSGFDVLADIPELLADPVNLPVLVLTADISPATRRKALSHGARDFVTKPFDVTEVLLRVRNLLDTRRLQNRLRQHNETLAAEVRKRTAELDQSRLETLTVLAATIEYRDDDTKEHTLRVGRIAGLLAAALELDDVTMDTVRQAAPLHDIGKLGIPDSILLKPGRLNDDERTAMQRHVDIGATILAPARSPVLRMAAQIARTHHERWDGRGYLQGLSGDEIPLPGRITAVADVFDALVHERPYKQAWPLDRALTVIADGAGTQFDPRVAAAFATLDHAALVHAPGAPLAEPGAHAPTVSARPT